MIRPAHDIPKPRVLFRDGQCGPWVPSDHFTADELVELGFEVRVESVAQPRVENIHEARVRIRRTA